MKRINHHLKTIGIALLPALLILASCNKEPEQFAPIQTPVYPTGSGIAATLAANPNFSMYTALIARAGLTDTLNNNTKTFTLYATDNTGMKIFVNAASGGAVPLNAPDAVFLGFISTTLPVASAVGIVNYNTVGQKFSMTSIGTAIFPNFPLPTEIILDPTQPFVRLPIFPIGSSPYAPYAYVNNLPITAPEMTASNGVIETTYSIVAPPQATLKTMIAAEPNLSYFRAAVARADSGAVGLNKFDSLMGYGVTNMTILAPNDLAFQNLIYGLVYSQTLAVTGGNTAIAAAQAGGAVAAGPAFLSTNNVTTAQVKGIIAYHFLASNSTGTYLPNIRAFSVNFPTTPGFFVKTLVNTSFATHPGILAVPTFAGPAVTSLKFTGVGTFPSGGTPFSGTAAHVTKMDNLGANGVYHIIDEVLLPQ
ncbi:MAG: fasciclin domain-containing protein [Bacteroidetes bacterium]|nr:fasciclin domain-containing protein [Bacteroidota bacterium]